MMANNFSYPLFTYEPLKLGQILLLGLSEKGGEQILQLCPFNLASALKYFGLSYTWGLDTQRQVIVVNGAGLKVSKSLKILLPYLFEKY